MLCNEESVKFFNASLGARVLIALALQAIPRCLDSILRHCDACRCAMRSKHPPRVLDACDALVLKSPTLLESGRVVMPISEVGVPLRDRLRCVRDTFKQRGMKALDELLLLLDRDTDRSQSLVLLPGAPGAQVSMSNQ
jgi:hypothetical protein